MTQVIQNTKAHQQAYLFMAGESYIDIAHLCNELGFERGVIARACVGIVHLGAYKDSVTLENGTAYLARPLVNLLFRLWQNMDVRNTEAADRIIYVMGARSLDAVEKENNRLFPSRISRGGE